MRLREYFKKNSTNLAKFCREKKLSYYTLRSLLEGGDCYLSFAVELELATDGHVNMYELAMDIKKPRRPLRPLARVPKIDVVNNHGDKENGKNDQEDSARVVP